MGDPAAPTVGDSTAQQLQAYTANLPNLMQVTANTALPTGQTLLNAQQQLAPQQQALATQLFNQAAPGLTQSGNAINQLMASGNLQNAATNQGGAAGQQLLNTVQQQQQAIDPQYYATRAAASNQLQNLLGSINLNGLSGSEQAQVERANAQQNAQQGTLNTPSQLNTVSNAMNFGTALNTKRTALEQALGSATSFLPSSQSGISAFNTVQGSSGGPATSNPGLSQFQGVQPVGQQSFSTGNSLLGDINNTALNSANINANRRSGLDVGVGAWQGITSGFGNLMPKGGASGNGG